jgi:hypothetical protein
MSLPRERNPTMKVTRESRLQDRAETLRRKEIRQWKRASAAG